MSIFHLETHHDQYRTGLLTTPHGTVQTPAFMPVGTQATVKAVTPEMVVEAGAEMILANTYHLHLRPGSDVVAELGGLHRFMHWDGPILTDSGGFQVYSLAKLRKIDDDGITFQSHIDGSTHHFSPERVVEMEAQLGADIIMALDECTPYPCEYAAAEAAVERTTRWAVRCQAVQRRSEQALFGIVQGSIYPELRRKSAHALVELELPGYAIGGLSVGEGRRLMREVLEETVCLLPEKKPRYLMGVGTPVDFLLAVEQGIDMMDCVVPTRAARNATLYTSEGKVNIRRAEFARDPRPLDPHCPCPTCKHYSRAYLRHLYVAREMLAGTLGTIHNITYFQHLMEQIRAAIRINRFHHLREQVLAVYPDEKAEPCAPDC